MRTPGDQPAEVARLEPRGSDLLRFTEHHSERDVEDAIGCHQGEPPGGCPRFFLHTERRALGTCDCRVPRPDESLGATILPPSTQVDWVKKSHGFYISRADLSTDYTVKCYSSGVERPTLGRGSPGLNPLYCRFEACTFLLSPRCPVRSAV